MVQGWGLDPDPLLKPYTIEESAPCLPGCTPSIPSASHYGMHRAQGDSDLEELQQATTRSFRRRKGPRMLSTMLDATQRAVQHVAPPQCAPTLTVNLWWPCMGCSELCGGC